MLVLFCCRLIVYGTGEVLRIFERSNSLGCIDEIRKSSYVGWIDGLHEQDLYVGLGLLEMEE